MVSHKSDATEAHPKRKTYGGPNTPESFFKNGLAHAISYTCHGSPSPIYWYEVAEVHTHQIAVSCKKEYFPNVYTGVSFSKGTLSKGTPKMVDFLLVYPSTSQNPPLMGRVRVFLEGFCFLFKGPAKPWGSGVHFGAPSSPFFPQQISALDQIGARLHDSFSTLREAKFLGSGESMVARLELKGIDGRAPPGVEPMA